MHDDLLRINYDKIKILFLNFNEFKFSKYHFESLEPDSYSWIAYAISDLAYAE